MRTLRILTIVAVGAVSWSAPRASAQKPEGVVRVISVDEGGAPLPDVPFYLRQPGCDWILTRGRTGPDGAAEVELIDSAFEMGLASFGPEIIAGIDAVQALPREDLVMCVGLGRHDIRLRAPKLGRLRIRVAVDDEPRRHRDLGVRVHGGRDVRGRCPTAGRCAIGVATQDGAFFEGESGLESIVHAEPYSIFGTRYAALPRRLVFPPERSEIAVSFELDRQPDWIFLARDAPRPNSPRDPPRVAPILRLEIPNEDDRPIETASVRLSTAAGGRVQVLEIDARNLRELGRARAVLVADRSVGELRGAPVSRFEFADFERVGSSLCGWRGEATDTGRVIGRITASSDVLVESKVLLVGRDADDEVLVSGASCQADGRFEVAFARDPFLAPSAARDSERRPNATLLFVKGNEVVDVRRVDLSSGDGRLEIGDWSVERRPAQVVIVRCPLSRSWERPQFFLDIGHTPSLAADRRFRAMLAVLGLSAPLLADEGYVDGDRLLLPARFGNARLRVARGYDGSFLVDALLAAGPVPGRPDVLDLGSVFASLEVRDGNGREVDAFVRGRDLEAGVASDEFTDTGNRLTFLSAEPRVFVGAIGCRGAFVSREDWDKPVRLEAMPSRRVRLSKRLQQLGDAHLVGLEIVDEGSATGDAFAHPDGRRFKRCAVLRAAETAILARSGEELPIRVHVVRLFGFGGFLSLPDAAACEISEIRIAGDATLATEDLVVDATVEAVDHALRALALYRADLPSGVDRFADRFFR